MGARCVVDFCFTARGFTAGLEKRVVYHDELVALLPAAHPLAAKEKVTLADLASEPFVLLDEANRVWCSMHSRRMGCRRT